MSEKKSSHIQHTDIAELNSYNSKIIRHSMESSNVKPYDITRMTGKPSGSNNNNRQEE